MKEIQKDETQKEERDERRGTSDAMKVFSLPNYIYHLYTDSAPRVPK